MNNRKCAKNIKCGERRRFWGFREKITLKMRIILFLYICYGEVSPGQSRVEFLFKVRFQFLVTCLSGQVRLLHGLRRGWGPPRYCQSSWHCVHPSEWSVFRQVVDESESEMLEMLKFNIKFEVVFEWWGEPILIQYWHPSHLNLHTFNQNHLSPYTSQHSEFLTCHLCCERWGGSSAGDYPASYTLAWSSDSSSHPWGCRRRLSTRTWPDIGSLSKI